MAEQPDQQPTGIIDKLPTDQLKHELTELLKVAGQRATKSVTGKLAAVGRDKLGAVGRKATGALKGAGEQVGEAVGGDSIAGETAKAGLKGATKKVAEKVTGGGGGGGRGAQGGKVTNIIEEIDLGVPIQVAYDQWTRFTDFPGFMKKVESVEQVSDTELKWRGRVLWSSRDWKSTIVDQVPDKHIIWRSEGAKGYVDGAVSFHQLAPELTRILVVLEYYPQGLVEKTANLWRAQGRRARLELKHFRRHVMTQVALNPEEVEGWRGEIHDSEVTRGPDQAAEDSGETDQAAEDSGETDQAAEDSGETDQSAQDSGDAGQATERNESDR